MLDNNSYQLSLLTRNKAFVRQICLLYCFHTRNIVRIKTVQILHLSSYDEMNVLFVFGKYTSWHDSSERMQFFIAKNLLLGGYRTFFRRENDFFRPFMCILKIFIQIFCTSFICVWHSLLVWCLAFAALTQILTCLTLDYKVASLLQIIDWVVLVVTFNHKNPTERIKK